MVRIRVVVTTLLKPLRICALLEKKKKKKDWD